MAKTFTVSIAENNIATVMIDTPASKVNIINQQVMEEVVGTTGSESWSVGRKGLGILEKNWSKTEKAVKLKVSTAKAAPAR